MRDLLKEITFEADKGRVENKADGSVSLVMERAPIGEKFFPVNTCFSFSAKTKGELFEYAVIEYSSFGVKRPLALKAPAFVLSGEGGAAPLFLFDDVTTDNRCHSIIAKVPEGGFELLKASFYVDKVLKAHFTVHRFFTCNREELSKLLNTDEKAENILTKIDISADFNAEYDFDEFSGKVDTSVFFDRERISPYGIEFDIKTDGNNLVYPDSPPEENDEPIVNFGAKTKKRLCRPVSRDGEMRISINKKATELYFVLTLARKHHIRAQYGTGGTVLGGKFVDILKPLYIEDVEYFMVEVIYKDGRRDTHLPLNIGMKRHGLMGDTGVYAVPADGSEVEDLVIHNRCLDFDVALAAVTVNETDVRLHPEMLIPEKITPAPVKVSCEKGFLLDGKTLKVKNGAISAEFSLSDGLYLKNAVNDFTPNAVFGPCDVLSLRSAEGEITAEFEFKGVTAGEEEVFLSYEKEKVSFKVGLDISGENSIGFSLTVKNNSDKDFKKGIIFPNISKIDFGSFDENWYFVPKYQNLNSNETFYMYEESAPSFPMQFMDVYSPFVSGGLCLTTEERELVTRKYSLSKNSDGMEMYVEYPIIYSDTEPNGSFEASYAVITAHEGDWRAAFGIYKKWLESWYEPYKCQNKRWYRECFWLLAEITDFVETDEIIKFPCWYDEEKKEFNFRKILEEQKGITGVYPDILHMWSWTNQNVNGEYAIKWGNFGDEDYDKYGGREAFREALHDIRDNLGIQMSLYMHPTLLTDSYPQAEKFFKKSKVLTEGGGNISIFGNTFRLCHAEQEWRDFILSRYPAVYEDLGIPLLYVDEFSLRVENRCYAPDHGHRVPSSLLKTDRDFITRLKDMMPEEVVLYGEYAAADVNARYIDCNISYYILDSIVDLIETSLRAGDGDDRLGRVFTNVYRFAFPKIVQLVLPMAMRNLSWHPQKAMFYNGEAIYDSFWDCEESRGLDFTVKAYGIKKKYADLFTSDCPEALIETESPAICMNSFPKNGRTLYTVYNRAYSTFRGDAVKLPYKKGMRIYDVWNEKELSFRVEDGLAVVPMEIGAQEVGCILTE